MSETCPKCGAAISDSQPTDERQYEVIDNRNTAEVFGVTIDQLPRLILSEGIFYG